MKVIWTSEDNTRAIEDHDGKLFIVWRQPLHKFINFANIPFQTYLTRREKQIMEGISVGLCNKEISKEVNLSVRTVKFHTSNIFRKFGVKTRGELMGRVTHKSTDMVQ